MKMIKINTKWQFQQSPFRGYFCELVYGLTKKSSAFIPVMNVQPDEKGILPENKFIIVKDQSGKFLIKDGEDKTNRLFLLVGIEDGFRGGSAILSENYFVASCWAGNACHGRRDVAVILKPSESIVFSTFGRYGKFVKIYEWDGNELSIKEMKKSEYEYLQSLTQTEETQYEIV